MMNVFTLAGTIAINAAAAHKAIDGTTQKAESASKNIGKAFEKIGSAAVKCGKVIATGMAAGTAAIGALLKNSIGEYAEYEQLVGGVETLFQDSQDKVMAYAKEAYKTAGLSANEYMSTVTSFSASLLQGLGGDTEAAAIMADKAITDMADNANKMGTSMSSIQDAYQGFAKQNYTMLDNLKLGYGGTQEEMARLVNESGVLGAAIKVDAKTINEVSFDKIIEAIHIIQERMGITGTTAEEASETISGSFASFKATWRNLMVGLSDGKSDIGALLANTLNAGELVWQNIKKVLPTLKSNILVALTELGGYLDGKIREVVWPKIQEIFKVKLGIELPDWDIFKTNVSTWWNNTVSTLDTICTWTLKHLGLAPWTDEDTLALRAWWDAVYKKIDAICAWILKPEFPDPDVVIADLTAWWEETKKNLKLTFGITPRVEGYVSSVKNTAGNYGTLGNSFVSNSDSFINFGAIWDALIDGSHADGLDRVPFDGYRATLHKDEAVLTRQEAGVWRNGDGIKSAVRDAMSGIQFNVVLDSGVLVGQLAPQMDMRLGTISGRKGRGN